jgi:pimeloyl-ACP methyl ester carboxylesterase
MPARSRTLAGRSIAVHEAGAGRPVVLVHSTGLSAQQWARLSVRLARRRSVLAPDLLGYGRSEPWLDPDAFHFAEDVAVVAALLTELDEPAHLVGHSYGGLLALHAALRDPSRVRSLALYEPVAFGVLHARGDREALDDLDRADVDGTFFDPSGGGGPSWMRRFIEYWNGPGAFDALGEERRAALLATGRKAFLEVRSLLHDRTPPEAYAALACPTLLLAGSLSPLAARGVCRALAEALPRVSVETLEGAGHMAPVVQADRVNAAIEAHLDRVDG